MKRGLKAEPVAVQPNNRSFNLCPDEKGTERLQDIINNLFPGSFQPLPR